MIRRTLTVRVLANKMAPVAIRKSRKRKVLMFYCIAPPDAPWGDYGDILIHGMADHQGRKDGLVQLERTGPFMPPITFPGLFYMMVVTDALRRELEQCGLVGMAFRSVIKAHIVELPWREWDTDAEEPQEYAESGEPPDYILERSHSPELAAQLGDLWELYPAREVTSLHGAAKVVASEPTLDWLVVSGLGVCISERTRTVLARSASDWVVFRPVVFG